MFKQYFYSLLLFVFLILICGFTGCDDNADQNVYDLGQTIVLTLESNATTGYGWQLADPIDPKIIKFISSQYIAPKTELVGAGGKEEWAFETVGKGSAKIELKYVRPWEKDQAPVKTKTFILCVI